ncbi:MAG: hypothetical protein IKK73_07805 [Akkermansia sp.]|nr:hypothetical protein [Akkermansia sp.]
MDMVYRLSEPERKSKMTMLRWVFLRSFLPVFIITYVVLSLLGSPWALIASSTGAVLAAGINFCIYVRVLRRQADIGDWFVTLTEAGMMIETPRTGAKAYVAWQRIVQARKVGTMLMVYLESDFHYLFPLENMRAERVDEMCRYFQERVKKHIPPEEQIRMPEECVSPTPVCGVPTREARAELADVLVCQVWSPWVKVFLLCCACVFETAFLYLVWCFYTSASQLEPVDVILILGGIAFSLMALFFMLRRYIHPGCQQKKWINTDEPGELHVTKNHVLAATPGAAWSVMPVSQVSRAWQLRHNYVYEYRTGGAFGLSLDEQPPAHLPQPQKPRRAMRNLMLALFVAVLPALAFGAFLLFGGSDEAEYREAAQRGEKLAGYVESLTPVHGFPGKIDYCTVYSDEEHGYTTIYISWEEDTSCCLIFGESPAEPEP